MSYTSRGFTVIELAIVILMVGVLASLAVAAYQTFTVRAQIAAGINFAAAAKGPIVDAYTIGGIAAANRAATGMTPLATDSRGSYVSSVEIAGGRIDVTFGGPLAQPGHRRRNAGRDALRYGRQHRRLALRNRAGTSRKSAAGRSCTPAANARPALPSRGLPLGRPRRPGVQLAKMTDN